MTARNVGRPKACDPRAIAAAIFDTMPLVEGSRSSITFPKDWTHPNIRAIARAAVGSLSLLGADVKEPTVLNFIYAERKRLEAQEKAGIKDAPDPRGVFVPGPDSAMSLGKPSLIRHAADMLNHDGKQDRDRLIDDIWRWCAERTQLGDGYPRRASELALAYRASQNCV